MSSYTSVKGSKAMNASDQSRGNRGTVAETDDRTGDNPTCADHILDRKHQPYPKKYGAIFAQLAIKEQMVTEEKEKKHREEEEEEYESKLEAKKKKMELDGNEKRRERDDEDEDDDDDWEDVQFSEISRLGSWHQTHAA